MKFFHTILAEYKHYKSFYNCKETHYCFTSIKQKKDKEYTSRYNTSYRNYSYYYQIEMKTELTRNQIDLLNKVTMDFIDIYFTIKVKDMTDFLINLRKYNFTMSKRQPRNNQTIRFYNKHVYIYLDFKNQKYFLENK